MSKVADRVLVAAGIAASRSKDERFAPSEVIAVFLTVSVPPPGNMSASLAALEGRSMLIKFPDGRRGITPLGKETIRRLGYEVLPQISADLKGEPAASFAHVDHTVIPSWVAPPRWGPGIKRLLDKYPFDSNVFGMTRFPSEGNLSDPVSHAIEVARDELKKFGLTLHLASDGAMDDDLFGNVGAYMWACRYGLGFVEDRVGRGLNYNTVIELGGMSITGRRCAILKDHTAPTLPTDLLGHIYKSVDFDDEASVRASIRGWATGDLSVQAVPTN